ncbi:MAG: class I SAM-dependent methyltransferase [Bdellovibrionales bacterium]|nr:class I SAM-dependent methyltransferase [Bdellovibrionales bacterium]
MVNARKFKGDHCLDRVSLLSLLLIWVGSIPRTGFALDEFCDVYLHKSASTTKFFDISSSDPASGRGEETQTYMRTNRSLSLATYLPDFFRSSETISQKKVLDIGTGGGQVVTDLRDLGAEAVGVDVYLNSKQKKFSYFKEATAERLPFEEKSFDYVISGDSVFDSSYATQASDLFMTNCLKELARVLKPDGRAYLKLAGSKRLIKLLESIPKLEVVRHETWVEYLELKRIPD